MFRTPIARCLLLVLVTAVAACEPEPAMPGGGAGAAPPDPVAASTTFEDTVKGVAFSFPLPDGLTPHRPFAPEAYPLQLREPSAGIRVSVYVNDGAPATLVFNPNRGENEAKVTYALYGQIAGTGQVSEWALLVPVPGNLWYLKFEASAADKALLSAIAAGFRWKSATP